MKVSITCVAFSGNKLQNSLLLLQEHRNWRRINQSIKNVFAQLNANLHETVFIQNVIDMAHFGSVMRPCATDSLSMPSCLAPPPS
jgi:hypothetical protein